MKTNMIMSNNSTHLEITFKGREPPSPFPDALVLSAQLTALEAPAWSVMRPLRDGAQETVDLQGGHLSCPGCSKAGFPRTRAGAWVGCGRASSPGPGLRTSFTQTPLTPPSQGTKTLHGTGARDSQCQAYEGAAHTARTGKAPAPFRHTGYRRHFLAACLSSHGSCHSESKTPSHGQPSQGL